MRSILQDRSWRVAARVAAGCAVLWLAAPGARADSCEAPLHTVETSAVQSLSCPVLRGLEESMRACAAAAPSPGDRLAQARYAVSVAIALRRCLCDNAPTAAGLTSKLSGTRTVYALAQLIAGAGQARACATTDAQRRDLDVFDGKLQQLKAGKAYCSSADADVERFAKSRPGTCYEARLRHAAAGYAVDCGGAVTADTVRALEDSEGKMHCAVAAPSCDATQADADRLRHSSSEGDERQLWNLVATRLTAAAGARATREDRACANRMITTAVSDSAIADRNDRTEAESVSRDPQLRARFAEALKKALNESGQVKELARMLNDGADVKQVIAKANQLDDEKRRQFFAIAGGLGRSLEAARAFSAFEQNSRGFDIVIAPRPTACHLADFVNVLLAGLQKATPARIVNVDRNQASQATTELLAARKQSCGDKAPNAVAGPGCGAVAEVVVEDRANGRAGGQVRLHFVAPDGRGGALTRETQTIRIHDFKLGCGAASEPAEESAAAQKLVFDLQFAFATNPHESAVVLDRPVRTEVCGLRALKPVEQPAGKYDGNGLQILGQELDDKLQAPANGAREALAVWKYSVGEIDPRTASANLRFSSVPYSEGDAKGHKIQADLTLGDRPAASFATVVLDGANDCSATPAERDIQAGRMIGNEAGSLLARQAIRTPGAKAEAAKTETAKAEAAKAEAAKAEAAKTETAKAEAAKAEIAKAEAAKAEAAKAEVAARAEIAKAEAATRAEVAKAETARAEIAKAEAAKADAAARAEIAKAEAAKADAAKAEAAARAEIAKAEVAKADAAKADATNAEAAKAKAAKAEAAKAEAAKAEAAKAEAAKAEAAKARIATADSAKVDTTKATAPKAPAPNTVVPRGPAPGTPTRPVAQGQPIPTLPADARQPGRWRAPAAIVGISLALGGLLLVEDANQQDSTIQKLGIGADKERTVGGVMLLSAIGGFLVVTAYDRLTR